MRRATLFLLLFCALPLPALEKWREAYDKGVAAVNAQNYRGAADALQIAIAERPNEGLKVRSGRRELVTYVPHFWLGIAKFNLGDVDGALREWNISTAQGVVAKTRYRVRMQEWIARAQAEKLRLARAAAASAPKKTAPPKESPQTIEVRLPPKAIEIDLPPARTIPPAAVHERRSPPEVVTATRADPTPAQAAIVEPPDLRLPYRAYARGDFKTAEALLDEILKKQQVAEAYLLRGCSRYTRAMLSSTPEALLLAATEDFRAALRLNPALRIDTRNFSPKLVQFFEATRGR